MNPPNPTSDLEETAPTRPGHVAQADGAELAGKRLAQLQERSPEPSQERPQSILAYPATYALIGVNVAIFLIMSWSGPVPSLLRQHDFGSLLTAPFGDRALWFFGSSDSRSILADGQWWRLVSSNFVHVTPLHLLLNMWCLWNLGLFGEPLLGPAGLVAVYLLTGVAGMLQSLAFSVVSGHDVLVAGASGAIFGLAGILIVLLSNRRLALPWAELRSLRRQVIFFALANLALGVAPDLLPGFSAEHLRVMHLDPNLLPRIDNNAHVGGFLGGLALGLPLLPRMTSGRSSYRARQVLVFTTAALLLCLLAHAVASMARAAVLR